MLLPWWVYSGGTRSSAKEVPYLPKIEKTYGNARQRPLITAIGEKASRRIGYQVTIHYMSITGELYGRAPRDGLGLQPQAHSREQRIRSNVQNEGI